MSKKRKTVAVGMSGGVDSSVAAYLLKQAGYHVIGLFMKNWDDQDEACPAERDYQDVIAVCAKLDIPYYTVNFTEEYWDNVFQDFVHGLQMGITPNPDIFCNKEIKFKAFLDKAMQIGADYLATGHWAKIGRYEDRMTLETCADPHKDQTYFLYTLKEEQLTKILFPLAHFNKQKVREIARSLNLITHDKRDSTGICFIGKRKFKDFMLKFIKRSPGNFIDENGNVLKKHDGLAFYTIGQRKGLEIGGAGEAWYVANKNPATNDILVVQGENHPALFSNQVSVNALTWVNDSFFPKVGDVLTVKVRYSQDFHPCTIISSDQNTLVAEFKTAQRAVTPGQSAVFYQGSCCLGGGIIQAANRRRSLSNSESDSLTSVKANLAGQESAYTFK